MKRSLPKDAKEAYAVVSHTSKSNADGVIGHIWWDGKSVKSDLPVIQQSLKVITVAGLTYRDGLAFFNKLPLQYRDSYVSLKKVR